MLEKILTVQIRKYLNYITRADHVKILTARHRAVLYTKDGTAAQSIVQSNNTGANHTGEMDTWPQVWS